MGGKESMYEGYNGAVVNKKYWRRIVFGGEGSMEEGYRSGG